MVAATTVTIKDTRDSNLFPKTIEWWHQVTEAPDDNKIIVFNKGTFQGSKVKIKAGGQIPPIEILGLKLKWKKAQKNAKKKNI